MQKLANHPKYILIIWSWWKRTAPAFLASGYEVWAVEGKPSDRLVLIDERADYAAIIAQLLADETQTDALVFLHRRSHNPVEDLKSVTDALRSADAGALRKAFAFSDGRDYLYLSANEWGLIGNEGQLWYSSGGTKMRSAEAAANTVRRTHFDKVWQYYSQQCKRKLLELKEELLAALWVLPVAQSTEAVDNQTWLRAFKKEKPLLYARLLDLANEDSPKFNMLLEQAEQKSQEKLRFGECRLNFSELNPADARAQYQHLADFIRDGIVNLEAPVLVSDSLRMLRDRFDDLLHALPESTYP